MKYLLLFCTLGLASYTYGQTKMPMNSGEVLKEAVALHDKGEYKKAIDLYKTIPRNDTNYVKALYELSLSCYYDSSFQEGLRACDEALKITSLDLELDLLISKGNLLDESLGAEKALRFYDSVLTIYPQAQSLLFNKAITLLKTDKLAEAKRIFQQLVMQNPYYASAHLRLATCAFKEGRVVPAMMSLLMYLTISPGGTHHITSVRSLSDISKVTPSVIEAIEKRNHPENTFSHVEQTIVSKVALDKNFKLQSGMDDPIIRQLQALIEVVAYDENSDDFWMQFYVPLFKTIFEKKQFEPLVMHSFSALDLDPIKRYMKKKEKEVKSTINTVVDYFNHLRSTRELNYVKRQNTTPLYHYENNVCFGTGALNAKSDMVGQWTFYYPNGNVKATGSYNDEGKKNGDWVYYYANGKKSGLDKWNNGVQWGDDVIYSESGNITSLARFSNGKLEGEKKTFYSIGTLKTVVPYKNGSESGKYIEYYNSGRKRLEADMSNDKFHGNYKSFYQNGEVEVIASYKNGTLDGPYKSYYDNGQLSFEATYSDGKINGQTRSYHKNGKIKQLRSLTNDLIEGNEEEYNDEGKLISVTNYVKGKAQGLASYYDNDGKLYSTFLFDKNILKEAKYFDKQGKEIASSIRKNKNIALTVHGPEGYKRSFTNYNDAGQIIGDNHYYYPTGKIRETNTYKEGVMEGYSTGFYETGQKYYDIAYEADQKNGPATYYHFNGKIRLTGWHKNGDQVGDWTEYNENGNIISSYSYLHNELHGYYTHHYVNGKLDYEERYNLGWLTGLNTYDTLGNIISSETFVNGKGSYKGLHLNGRKKFEGTYVDGELHGPFTNYFFDGTILSTKTYDKGLLNGAFTVNHFGGQPELKGAYKMGKRTGTWKYYETDGKIWREETYVDGVLNGLVKIYYANGKIDREIEYKDGEKNGTMKRYSEDGLLMSIGYYKDDLIYGYAYLDKDQKLTALQPLLNGTGKMVSYYSNGKKSVEADYSDGKINGTFQTFSSNGTLIYETKDSYGYTEGELKKFYSNGKKKTVYTYTANVLNGPYKEYYENGNLKEEGEYYFGEKNGDVKYYDVNGKLHSQHYYYYGTLLSVKK